MSTKTKRKKKTKRQGKPRVIKKVYRQIGKSVASLDKKRKAMAPGKRISKKGNVYYEYRANRSDLDPRKKI